MFSENDVNLIIEYILSLSGKEMNMLKMLMSNGVSGYNALDQVIDKRTQKIESYLRTSVNGWRKSILDRYNNTCFVSNITRPNGMEVHHVNESFDNLVKKAFIKCNLDYRAYVKDFNPRELSALSVAIEELHKTVEGVVLLKEVHQLFHKEYGQNNNNMEQLNILRNKFKSGVYSFSVK